ncbi:MAG: glutamine--fructose-6-phosphate transaminase (isomerizing) [Thermoplasmata archaeon]
MCGITGYVGSGEALPVLMECLKRLEYRGYDSCGVAVAHDGEFFRARAEGRIEKLGTQLPTSISGGYLGMAHTRWATHGRADLRNAHPLVSCDGNLVVAHNGIIDNADELRTRLTAGGHRFTSDTDSEVIPHLLEQKLRDGESIEEAMLDLPKELHGTFAMIVAQRGNDGLYVTRRGSPLVIGVGDHEYIPASDIPSFLPRTTRVLYLRENDCLNIRREGVRIFERDPHGAITFRPAPAPSIVNLDVRSTSKGSFEFYMIKEIMEQTQTLERIVRRADQLLAEPVQWLQDARRIILVGAGTSYHACLYGEYLFARVSTRMARAYIASEFETVAPLVDSSDVVLALSQSGETHDTIEAVRMARERGATILALTNAELSPLGEQARRVIPLYSGTEHAVAATKSYTAQLALLHQMVFKLADRRDEGEAELWQARDALINLTSDAAREHARRTAEDLVNAKSVFLVGRDIHRVTALEAALKLKEVATMRAEAFPGGEMKHGPLALIEEGTPVISFYDEPGILQAEASASELSARGARVYTIGPRPLRDSVDHIRVMDTGLATVIPQILPMQTLAYELARRKHLDPDHPRNLAKAVTVP